MARRTLKTFPIPTAAPAKAMVAAPAPINFAPSSITVYFCFYQNNDHSWLIHQNAAKLRTTQYTQINPNPYGPEAGQRVNRREMICIIPYINDNLFALDDA
jgi:hypothetical protein